MKADKLQFEGWENDYDVSDYDAALAEKSYYEFVRVAWPILHPTQPFVDSWHIGAICDHVEAVVNGQINNLLITVAPRMTKSMIVSVCLVPKVWIKEPSSSFMYTSFGINLASDHSVKSRRIIESQWYKRHWGDKFRLTSDQNEKLKYENDKTGVRTAFGMGGVAGQGAKYQITDDPHDTRDWTSPARMKAAVDTYDSAVYNRVNDPNDPRRIVVLQRISDKDLGGHLVRQGGWEHLLLPTVYEPARSKVTSIGWKDPRTRAGQLLCEARFNQAEVDKLKKSKPRIFNAQHQQNPSTDESAIFKRDRWKYYSPDPKEMVKKMEVVIMSVDAAFKDKQDSSMVAIHIYGKWGAYKFLLDRQTEHMGFNDTVDAIRQMSRAWPMARAKVVEDKANGPAIINHLKGEISGIIAWPPEGEKMDSKIARAWAAQPEQQAGDVWLPDPDMIPWVNDFVEIMAAFPEGEYDDDVDAFSQAMQRLERTPSQVPPEGVGKVQGWLR